jgi:hypothetical protein
MTDFRTPTRAALMARIKAYPDVAALIPKASNYPGTVPATRTFPFSRIGSMIGTPLRATGLASASFMVIVQGFTKDVTDTAGRLILPAEDNAAKIGSAFEAALELAELPMLVEGTPYRAQCTWLQTTTMMDGDEAGAWMVTATFRVDVTG